MEKVSSKCILYVGEKVGSSFFIQLLCLKIYICKIYESIEHNRC